MRDLINIVTESRGLGARRPGEEFVSTTNPDEKIYINTVRFYPDRGGMFDSPEELNSAVEQLKSVYTSGMNVIGDFKASDRAFGVAVFDRDQGGQLVFLKPFKSVKPDPTQNAWSNQDGIPGYRYNSKAAAKTQAGMTPQDILTQQSDLDASAILDQIIEKFGQDSPQGQAATAVAMGQEFPIEVPAAEGESFTAFRDYFCELLHPIALQTGNYSGNAGEAAEKFLGDATFADCSINFGTDKTEGLSDSILIAPSGQKIKVSSKGAGGATASAKNIVDAAKEVAKSNPKLLQKHREVIALIQDIVNAGQAGAPLVLGVKYGIITQEDATDIQNFKKLPNTTLDTVGEMGISDGLKTLIAERGTKEPDNLNLYFHSIAAVAHKAAEHVNDNTNFSKAASEILNNGALIQVYTKAVEQPGQWIIQSFETVWPSSTVTGVSFSAGKTYYSTGIKGNFTFKILKNGATDVEDESNEVGQTSAKSVAKPKSMTGGRVDIRPRSSSAVTPSKGVGREKR